MTRHGRPAVRTLGMEVRVLGGRRASGGVGLGEKGPAPMNRIVTTRPGLMVIARMDPCRRCHGDGMGVVAGGLDPHTVSRSTRQAVSSISRSAADHLPDQPFAGRRNVLHPRTRWKAMSAKIPT